MVDGSQTDLAQRTAELTRTVGDLMENHGHADQALALSEQLVALQESAETLNCHGEALFCMALQRRRERRSHGGRKYFLRSAEAFCKSHEKDPSLVAPLTFCGQYSLGRCYHVLRVNTPGWSTMSEDAREHAIDEWIAALQVYSPTAAAQRRHREDMKARVASLEEELRVARLRLASSSSSDGLLPRELIFARYRRVDMAAERMDVPDAPVSAPRAAMQTVLAAFRRCMRRWWGGT